MSQLKGLSFTTSLGTPVRPLRGIVGVSVSINAFATCKVTTRKGRGLFGVSVTLPDNRVFQSDSAGNIALPELSNGDVLVFRKNLVTVYYTWSTGQTQFTVIIEPPPIPVF